MHSAIIGAAFFKRQFHHRRHRECIPRLSSLRINCASSSGHLSIAIPGRPDLAGRGPRIRAATTLPPPTSCTVRDMNAPKYPGTRRTVDAVHLGDHVPSFVNASASWMNGKTAAAAAAAAMISSVPGNVRRHR